MEESNVERNEEAYGRKWMKKKARKEGGREQIPKSLAQGGKRIKEGSRKEMRKRETREAKKE